MTDTPRHSVSVTGIVVRDDGRVLVVQRRDNGHWEPPGDARTRRDLRTRRPPRGRRGDRRHVSVDRLTGAYKNLTRGIVALVFRCTPGHRRTHAYRRIPTRPLAHPRRRPLPHDSRLRHPRPRRTRRRRIRPRPRRRRTHHHLSRSHRASRVRSQARSARAAGDRTDGRPACSESLHTCSRRRPPGAARRCARCSRKRSRGACGLRPVPARRAAAYCDAATRPWGMSCTSAILPRAQTGTAYHESEGRSDFGINHCNRGCGRVIDCVRLLCVAGRIYEAPGRQCTAPSRACAGAARRGQEAGPCVGERS